MGLFPPLFSFIKPPSTNLLLLPPLATTNTPPCSPSSTFLPIKQTSPHIQTNTNPLRSSITNSSFFSFHHLYHHAPLPSSMATPSPLSTPPSLLKHHCQPPRSPNSLLQASSFPRPSSNSPSDHSVQAKLSSPASIQPTSTSVNHFSTSSTSIRTPTDKLHLSTSRTRISPCSVLRPSNLHFASRQNSEPGADPHCPKFLRPEDPFLVLNRVSIELDMLSTTS